MKPAEKFNGFGGIGLLYWLVAYLIAVNMPNNFLNLGIAIFCLLLGYLFFRKAWNYKGKR